MPSRSLVPDDSPHGPPAPRRRNHLLVIGVDAYVHVQPKLKFAKRDAEEFAQVMTARYQIEQEDVTYLLDAHATETAIKQRLREYKTLTEQDNLIIFFAGHGEYDDHTEEGYWIPADAKPNDTYNGYVSYQELLRLLKPLRAHHIWVIADSCYAGTLFPSKRSTKSFEAGSDALPSRFALCSGRKQKVPDQSPFARSLITFLSTNTSPELRIRKVMDYVEENTPKESDGQLPIGDRIPQIGDGLGEMILYAKRDHAVILAQLKISLDLAAIQDFETEFQAVLDQDKALKKTVQSLKERAEWNKIKADGLPEAWLSYIRKYRLSVSAPVTDAIEHLEDWIKQVSNTESDDLKLRIGQLEDQVSALKAVRQERDALKAQSASHTQQLQVRDTQLQTLEQALHAAAAELESQSASHTQQLQVRDAQLQALEQELAALRAAPQILPPKPGILVPEMILIQGGTFQMGSKDGENREKPVREVTVPDFFLGKYPVTVAEYHAYCEACRMAMPEEPTWGWQDNHPVVNVPWEDAQAYCVWLAEQTGTAFRLPSEAEWEYAAGGGLRRTKWAGTSDESKLREYAWYQENSQNQTQPVGQKQPNSLGLCDMSGNIWEWCEDHWHNTYENAPTDGSAWLEPGNTGLNRVLRGGSWVDDAQLCRVSFRNPSSPGYRRSALGFRLAAPPVQQR